MAVLEYVDLTLEELKSLAEKAEKTVFTMAVSPIEVHGPHLPLGTDILIATAVRDRVQSRVSQKDPDVTFVNLPPLFGSDASVSRFTIGQRGVFDGVRLRLLKVSPASSSISSFSTTTESPAPPRYNASQQRKQSRHRFYLVESFYRHLPADGHTR